MTPFTTHTGIAAPLRRINIDTDAIIPSREMTTVTKRGLSGGLFAGWRYTDPKARTPDPDFVLNQPAYADSTILLSGHNFGCGSSREHAVWALVEFGIRCIIAPSFGAIFQNNCVRNGLLPVELPDATVQTLAEQVADDPQHHRVTVDLTVCTVTAPDGRMHGFALADGHRHILLNGLDPIGVTQQHQAAIDAFARDDRRRRPWAYPPALHTMEPAAQ